MDHEMINLNRPKPLEKVGAKFTISGSVPKSWLRTRLGTLDTGISLKLLDIDGKIFMGTSVPIRPTWFSKFTSRIYFVALFQFHPTNVGFIEKSQGRIVLWLEGQDESKQTIFVPIVVEEFEPEGDVNLDILEQHKNVGKNVIQYKEDLKIYNQELEKLRMSRKAKDEDKTYRNLGMQDMEIAREISKILEESEESYGEYAYSEEDKREKELEGKYKKAIEWRGPLLRGIISKFGEFELRVYSDDHDKHFHVIHKGKRINARFSFPDIRLVSYKNSQNTISSKSEAAIRELCQKPEIFDKLQKWFDKRP